MPNFDTDPYSNRCQGELCQGLGWPASLSLPHPRTCLADPSKWPGPAAIVATTTPTVAQVREYLATGAKPAVEVE